LQVKDSLCQFAQSTRLDGFLSVLEVYYCALGNSVLARKTIGRKLLRLRPDLI
jgi:hypothetical protein